MAEMEFAFEGASSVVALETFAYMFYPEDKNIREQYIASVFFDGVAKATTEESIEIPVDFLKCLLLSPPLAEFSRQRRLITSEAALAGRAMLYYIELMETPNIIPSMARSKKLTENYMRMHGRDAEGNRLKKISEREVANSWRDYRKVAHLWAALAMLTETKGRGSVVELLDTNYLALVSTAETILAKFKSGFGEFESWTAPRSWTLPRSEIKCAGLWAGDIEFARAYKNITRGDF